MSIAEWKRQNAEDRQKTNREKLRTAKAADS